VKKYLEPFLQNEINLNFPQSMKLAKTQTIHHKMDFLREILVLCFFQSNFDA
jgi:hypothetical protein